MDNGAKVPQRVPTLLERVANLEVQLREERASLRDANERLHQRISFLEQLLGESFCFPPEPAYDPAFAGHVISGLAQAGQYGG